MPQVNPIIRLGLQDEAARLILDGKTTYAISKELGVSRGAVSTFKGMLMKADQSLQTNGIKAVARLEISQEEALSQLSTQLQQYTENYEKAMKPDGDGKVDEKAAYAWSCQRIALLDKMLRVTGLYCEKVKPPKDEEQQLNEAAGMMSDQELEERVKQIVERRTPAP
jgi:predicted transcriptional regulator